MKKPLNTSVFIVLFAAILLAADIKSQTILSEFWTGQGGQMAVFYRNVTKTDDLGNVYVAGSTLNGNNNYDILVQKFGADGVLLWQNVFNGAADMHDMAADIFIDDNYDVYVTGGCVQNASDSMDLIVIKYQSDSTFLWAYYYNNGASPLPHDAGTAITGDNANSIFVTGGSFGNGTLSDYITIRINATTGSQVWAQRYDDSQLNDVASKIELSGAEVFVSGGSQINVNPNEWELATVTYAVGNGTQQNVQRSGGSAIGGVDEVYDLTLDNAGSIYVTGATVNQSTGYDISLYKLNSQLAIVWEQHFDGHGGEDKGFAVKADAQCNLYVAGYVSTGSDGKNYALLKYDSAGVLQWQREFRGLAGLDDEATQLVIDTNNRVFVTGAARNTSHSDYVTVGFMPDGEIFAQATYNGPDDLDDKPTAMAIDINGDIIVAGHAKTTTGGLNTMTVKYKVYERPFDPVLINSVEAYNNKELLISFDTSVIIKPAIDRIPFQAGMLKDFVTQNTYTLMNQKLGFDCSRLETYKVFKRMTTADTISISRLGDTVRVGNFWSTLAVFIPEEEDLMETIDSLNTLKQIIHYAEPDYFGHLTGIPNDSLYLTEQSGLHSSKHGIKADSAWSRQTGESFVKVGIFDSGINYMHEDFGNGTFAGSKIAGGWDYVHNDHPANQLTPDFHGHGTAMAGIVGGLRNNGKGIAGVAGGDVQNGKTGCTLYSMGIAAYQLLLPPQALLHSTASDAIREGAHDTTKNNANPNNPVKGFGLHIQNHSWGSFYHSATLRNAVNFCFRNSCMFVASSGNDYNDTLKFPSCYNNEWLLKVGANDTSGTRVAFSTFDNNMDLIAPGTPGMYAAPDYHNLSGYTFGQTNFGTSISAAMASGAAALLYSQHHPNTHGGYPNSLAPEDIEMMLKRFATPVTKDKPTNNQGLPIPNIYAGYGRLNVDSALRKSSLPYRIRQFEHLVSASSAVLHASNQNVSFPEGLMTYPLQPGWTLQTDIYKLTVTLNHSIPQTESYIDGWVRNAPCDLYGLTNNIKNPHWSGTVMNSSNQNNATLTGYIYKIKIYLNGNHIADEWQPVNLSSIVKFAYSIYTLDEDPSADINKKDEMQGDLRIYPNPAGEDLNIVFNASAGKKIVADIYDISGRLVCTQNFIAGTERQSGKIDISGLGSGLYLCRFSSEGMTVTKKFIKE